MSTLKNIPKTLELVNVPVSIMVYGEPGRRKTTFAGTWPKPLIIDTDNGLVSLALHGKTPLVWTPDGHQDLTDLYFWIKEQVESSDIETIVIDTVDTLCMILMGEISDDSMAHTAGSKKWTIRDRFVPAQGDYYANQQQMFRFLQLLRRLNKHIVLIAAGRDNEGKSGPNVSNGMSAILCGAVSVVGELIIVDETDVAKSGDKKLNDGDSVLLTIESKNRATKSRFGCLKPYTINPTGPMVIDMVRDEILNGNGTVNK